MATRMGMAFTDVETITVDTGMTIADMTMATMVVAETADMITATTVVAETADMTTATTVAAVIADMVMATKAVATADMAEAVNTNN